MHLLSLAMGITAAVSVALSVFTHEIHIKNLQKAGFDFDNVVQTAGAAKERDSMVDEITVWWLKILQTIITLVMAAMLLVYKYLQLLLKADRKESDLSDLHTYFREVPYLAAELLVLLPHPAVFLRNDEALVFTSIHGDHVYSIETVLCFCTMLRVYTGMRVFRSLSIQRHLNARTMSIASSDIKIDSFFFWMKYSLDRSSALTMTVLTALFILWSSYLIRLAEAGGRENRFNLFADCVWYVVVTATTTGYGDLAPETVLGRTVGIFIMICGIIGAALATAVLMERLAFRPIESRFVEAIHAVGLQSSLRHLSARILQNFFKYIRDIKKANQIDNEHTRVHARAHARRLLDKYIRVTHSTRKQNLREQSESQLSTKAVVDDIHSHLTGELTKLSEVLDRKIDKVLLVLQKNGLQFPEEPAEPDNSPTINPY